MKYRVILLVFISFLAITGCATKTEINLEEAGFALDQGSWDKAITEAAEALESESGNVQAAIYIP